MDTGRKSNRTWGRRLLTALCVLLALILLLVIFAAVYVNSWLDKIPRATDPTGTLSASQIEELENQTDPEDVTFTGPTMDPLEVTWDTAPDELVGLEKDVINILLIGQDRRAGQGRQRSDAMILCTVNVKNKTLTMTSFLRDLYVQIPGYKDNRLNAAYQFGGMPLLDAALEVNFGVHVDGNVEVDFTGFQQVIDLVGGVDINLTAAEAAHLNKSHRSWGLQAGMNHLNGEKALAYSRIRYIGTDFGRTNRQRTVLTALLNQSKNLPYTQLMELVEQALGLITTDMTNMEIMQHAVALIPLLKDLEVQTQYIPAEGTYKNARIRGMSVLVPNLEANRRILIESLTE